MRALVVDTTEPAYNLALEETLFDELTTGEEGLFLLWRNAPSIIVGRHQCTGEEINADFVKRRGIPVVRRNTGGGAVYHDLGNLNFSFIEHADGEGKVDFGRYLTPICAALRELGVEAHISGRNDLEVKGRKISGSAQRLQHGKVLHHGTLLVDLNFSDLVPAPTGRSGSRRMPIDGRRPWPKPNIAPGNGTTARLRPLPSAGRNVSRGEAWTCV